MPDTPPFDASSAIIQLGPSRYTVDMPKFIVGILREEWDKTNADGVPINIDFSEAHKGVQFRGGDFIHVYEVAPVTRVVGVTYQWVNETRRISIEFLTSRKREHLYKMVGEAQRILWKHRTDTFEAVTPTKKLTGRQWLAFAPIETPMERNNRGFFRRVVDVEVRWVYREVLTA